jgi:hypothetical protein
LVHAHLDLKWQRSHPHSRLAKELAAADLIIEIINAAEQKAHKMGVMTTSANSSGMLSV